MVVIEDKILRYVAPSRLDYADQGTIWRVVKEDNIAHVADIYIQIGECSNEPVWVPVSKFLEIVFKDYLSEKEFIAACYHFYKTEDASKIIEILQSLHC